MCETSAIVDHELVVAARHASDLILGRYLRVPVAKAMNLGTPRGFDRAVAELAAALRSRSAASDAEAVRSVIGILDVDWLGTTAEQRRNLVARAMQAAGRITSAVPGRVETVFGPAADEVVDATRTAARRGQRLNIAADFNALDRRIVEHLRTSQTTYVRDEYGRRNAAFGERARTIVADGLESGLGRDDIAADLQAAAEGILTGRGQFYWEVVAGSFVSQGRSFAQLSAYAEAGIDRYLIEAVLDERTTEVCRFLHGKSFTVGAGLRTFERMEAEPDSVPNVAPWVREAIDPETGRKVLFVDSSGQRTAVAEVTRSGFGSRDDQGEFGRSLSEQTSASASRRTTASAAPRRSPTYGSCPQNAGPWLCPFGGPALASERASEERAATAASELKAIRERVVALEKRLRDDPTPEAVAELQKEVESLTRVLTELAEAPPTTSPEPWPRDLNSQPADASWGSDPEDLRGG